LAYNQETASTADRSSRVAPGLDALLVIDAIPAIARSSQPDGSIELVNRRWLDYTGLSPEEPYGWGWKTTVHVEDLAELLNAWEARDVQEGRECEVRLRRSDGVFHWFLVRRAPLHDETGAVVRWFGTGIHIEDSKRKERVAAAG
jgi:PAS domain S-box-containing protein